MACLEVEHARRGSLLDVLARPDLVEGYRGMLASVGAKRYDCLDAP